MSRRRPLSLAVVATTLVLVAPAAADARTYHGYVGPGSTIVLTNASGARVSRIPAGLHTFVIHDQASQHNFRLRRGSTVMRQTTLAFVGRRRWTNVRIRAGRTYTYDCVPHASFMSGTFRGVRA
ncbi:MAG: hypothetical protein KY396_00715 [Actinobacteria bacterium]|nr:hypothetical protein [Actinomycetota bacterium]